MTQTTLREYLRTTEDAISSGRIEEAMANCQNILTYFPEALEAQRLLGEVYLAQGQLEEAQQTFEWILTNDPENVIVYCDRALISERSSDIDTALDCYQQAYELSRGNANIRQEFNQLSARAGQQEFMFSRAGLARLYMRGDLLTQAIQEWDAVLAISPERLDARLGLMETYWREGMYDKAEQVASLLLEEVPTCLKALLFLAHIASISNIQRARDLLQRAESLDPDLAMAQEAFADLAASQLSDPFLELIKKEPILLEDGTPINLPPTSSPTSQQPAPAEQNTYGNWEMVDKWDQPTQASSPLPNQPVPETPAQPDWNSSSGELNTASPPQPEMPAAWQAQLEPQTPSEQDEQPWYQQDAIENWNSQENSGTVLPGWSSDVQEEDQTAHPAWLDTLTRSEQEQASTASPFELPTTVQPAEAASSPTPAPEAKPEPEEQLEEEPSPFFFPPEEENDSDMGWPEWLKSLGAEELEPEQTTPSQPLPTIEPTQIKPTIEQTPLKPAEEAPSWEAPQPNEAGAEADPWASLPPLSSQNDSWNDSNDQPEWMQQISPVEIPSAQNETPEWTQQFATAENTSTQGDTPEWMLQFSNTPSQELHEDATPSWMQQLSGVGNQPYQEPAMTAGAPVNEQEQRYLTSLEDLEKDLQSQGFVPMSPGSLASIAQVQTDAQAQSLPEVGSELSLSSALAQLGNFSQAPASQSENPGDPWWTQAGEPSAPAIPHTPSEPLNPFAALGARTTDDAPQPFAPLPATPAPTPLAPDRGQPLPPTPDSVPDRGQPLAPTYRSDVLLDSDLETTMKRPAITLQPMKPGESQLGRSLTNGQGHGAHKLPEPTDESNLSNHERLVRGYQYQLSGAYEESMQEYRLIIRNAPELLEDVISNLRALLKINPRFSLGYRVLGDAYMRKGEYLQAMESYNKALTMAKKAKN